MQEKKRPKNQEKRRFFMASKLVHLLKIACMGLVEAPFQLAAAAAAETVSTSGNDELASRDFGRRSADGHTTRRAACVSTRLV